MLNNHIYNLMLQLTEEHKRLWRIKTEYLKDARSCKECKAIWSKLAKDKEEHILDLAELIKHHMK